MKNDERNQEITMFDTINLYSILERIEKNSSSKREKEILEVFKFFVHHASGLKWLYEDTSKKLENL